MVWKIWIIGSNTGHSKIRQPVFLVLVSCRASRQHVMGRWRIQAKMGVMYVLRYEYIRILLEYVRILMGCG